MGSGPDLSRDWSGYRASAVVPKLRPGSYVCPPHTSLQRETCSVSGKLVIVTVVIAFLFGAAAGNVVGSLTNQGEDRLGNIMVGAIGGAFGSLLLQFMVPALSGFDDWRAIVIQMATAFLGAALLTVIVGVVAPRERF